VPARSRHWNGNKLEDSFASVHNIHIVIAYCMGVSEYSIIQDVVRVISIPPRM